MRSSVLVYFTFCRSLLYLFYLIFVCLYFVQVAILLFTETVDKMANVQALSVLKQDRITFPSWYDTVPKWGGDPIHHSRFLSFLPNGTFFTTKSKVVCQLVYSGRSDEFEEKCVVANVFDIADEAVLLSVQIEKGHKVRCCRNNQNP